MDRPQAEILCVGTELLAGKVNTHAAYLSVLLRSLGLDVRREATLTDQREDIRAAVAAAWGRASVVLVCGGLGPTFDDLTREGVSDALGLPLRYVPALFAGIRRKFFRFRSGVPESNKRQAWVLEGAEVLPNSRGSAPGQLICAPGKTLVLLPGPFSELKPMFEGQVLGVLRRRHGAAASSRRVFRFCGISEAAAGERLSPLLRRAGPGLEFTILAGSGSVDFHASAFASGARAAEHRLDAVERSVRRLLGRHLYGGEADTLESVLGGELKKRRWTLGTAESCTGGLVSQRLTSVPGSSEYFRGGVVAYSNPLKQSLLGVPEGVLTRFGAVSRPCARAMAEGARARLDCDAAMALTGIAGPGGGSRAKPVGLVFLAWALPGKTIVSEARFPGDRAQIRDRAATAALAGLWRLLK